MSENTSLKSQLIGELKDHKEQERLERVKENAKLKEVTIYVDGSPNTKRYITTLDQEGIKYKLLADGLVSSAEILANFFDGEGSVMVMTDDINLRNNRLNLLTILRNQSLILADFSKLS